MIPPEPVVSIGCYTFDRLYVPEGSLEAYKKKYWPYGGTNSSIKEIIEIKKIKI